jgi:probable addiction module antidote protein
MQTNPNDYRADLLADLRDPRYAAGYVSAAASESLETLLLALRDVADAQKGMGKVASEAGVNRENLYRMLSEEGNPRLSSLYSVLPVLGIKMEFIAIEGTISVPSKPTPQILARENQLNKQKIPGLGKTSELVGADRLFSVIQHAPEGLTAYENH